MADKNKNFNEVEDNEEIFVEEEQEVETPEAEEEEVVVEIKKENGFIKTCKKVGRIAEGALAIFGGLTAGLMIYDGVKTRKARKNYIPAQPQQIPSSTTQEVLNDVKITEF